MQRIVSGETVNPINHMPYAADLYFHLYNNHDESSLPVLLIHGAGGNMLSWPVNIRRLPGCKVFALDLPGHGKSPGRGLQTIAAYAQSVINWMNELKLNSAWIIGHSMGSAIALEIAMQFLPLVRGLAILGGAAQLSVSPQLFEAVSSETTYHQAVNMIVNWSFSLNADENVKSLTTKRMLENRSTVLQTDFYACRGFNPGSRLDQVACSVLVLAGELDKMIPMHQSQYLASKLPASKFVVLPKTGHMMMLENPIATASILEEFIHQNEKKIPCHFENAQV